MRLALLRAGELRKSLVRETFHDFDPGQKKSGSLSLLTLRTVAKESLHPQRSLQGVTSKRSMR